MTVRQHGGRRAALAVAGAATAAAVLLGGCSASDDSAGGKSSAADMAAPAAAPGGAEKAAGAPADTKPGTGGASAAPNAAPSAAANGQGQEVSAPRLIAYSAQLSLRTKEMAKVLDEARSAAGTAGGYVAGEQLGSGKSADGTPTDAKLTLKVPSAAFQQTLDRLAGLGEVLSRSSQADDLTQQVVDVESRLKTQQASVDRVRKLMAEAKTLSEIVSLESELSRRESDLESLQRRQQELSARTSLSTITLQVYTPAKAPEPVKPAKKEDGFWASVGGALAGGWHALVALVKGLLMVLAAIAPFALVLGPIGYLLWRLRRRLAALRPARPEPRPSAMPARPQTDPWAAPAPQAPEAPQASEAPESPGTPEATGK
ncbi:DUF4349 domain-containing protein [Kitasatospora sp. NPDC096147]|uniref:DUF4349 domain-containing protein n=1 Tax=Kitasatospora sp. NPDC096147 TaxID=3364093 RepID=UPI0038191514